VKKLLQEGITEKIISLWNSLILVTPKKSDANGQQKFRLVVDYRKLSEITIGNAYPLPDITEILDHLGQAKYFSCLDLVMGYHQIDMDQSDIAKTALSTKEGHWLNKHGQIVVHPQDRELQRILLKKPCHHRDIWNLFSSISGNTLLKEVSR